MNDVILQNLLPACPNSFRLENVYLYLESQLKCYSLQCLLQESRHLLLHTCSMTPGRHLFHILISLSYSSCSCCLQTLCSFLLFVSSSYSFSKGTSFKKPSLVGKRIFVKQLPNMFSCSFILFRLISPIELFYPVLSLTFGYFILSVSAAQLLCLVIILLSSFVSFIISPAYLLYLISQFHLLHLVLSLFIINCNLSYLSQLFYPVLSLPFILPLVLSFLLIYCILSYFCSSIILSCLLSHVHLLHPILFFSLSLFCLLSFIVVVCLNSSSH